MKFQRVDLSDLQQSLPVVDADGRPSPVFLRFINGAIRSLKNGVNSLIDVQNAVDAANAAAAAATMAAAASTSAAANAAAATAATTREQALVNSYIEPDSVLGASRTTITIAAHTRYYADGTSVAVSAGTVPASAPGDTDYVSYVDPTRAGGSVSYIASTMQPTQTGDTHVVGAVMIPPTGTATGGTGPRRPGFVEP